MNHTIAPTLRILIEGMGADGNEHGMACERELRALLAVARAAEHVVCEDRNRAPGTLHCSWQEAIDKTQRALARLKRASGGKP